MFVTSRQTVRLGVILHKDTGCDCVEHDICRLLKRPKHLEGQKGEIQPHLHNSVPP